MKKPELLAPAGNPEKLRIAFAFGADAVYCAGIRFSLRKAADNFTLAELAKGVELARAIGKRLYVTLNIYPLQSDMDDLLPYLNDLDAINPHGLIISDPGIMVAAREHTGIPCHVSTQASVMNWRAAAFWHRLGASRICVARELSLDECAEIARRVPVGIETFIHGAMCTSHSGKCVISNYTHGRDSNRGGCMQSCREHFTILDPETGTHEGTMPLMNSRDLNGLDMLENAIRLGIDALKIEGRMKSNLYVANTVAVYRNAIDTLFAQHAESINTVNDQQARWHERLTLPSNRTFTTGSLNSRAFASSINYDFEGYTRNADFIGTVKECSADRTRVYVHVRSPFAPGDHLHALTPDGSVLPFTVNSVHDIENGQIETAQANSIAVIENPGSLPALSVLIRPVEAAVTA